jgi:hypothetical protein
VSREVQSHTVPEKEPAPVDVQQTSDNIRFNFNNVAQEEGFTGLYKNVYPDQVKLTHPLLCWGCVQDAAR